jgi:hypothetical protein
MVGTSETSDEMLAAIEGFGYATGRRKQVSDFVFFAAESMARDGREEIMLSGCSKDLDVVITYLDIERDELGLIRPIAWREPGSAVKGQEMRVPAVRAMRGAIAKRRTRGGSAEREEPALQPTRLLDATCSAKMPRPV